MERTKTGMGIKLTLEERNILEAAVTLGDPVGNVKLSLWEKYGRRRLYVAFTNEETYFDLNDDSDLEINLRGDTEVMDAIEEFITNFLDLEADMEAPEPTPEPTLPELTRYEELPALGTLAEITAEAKAKIAANADDDDEGDDNGSTDGTIYLSFIGNVVGEHLKVGDSLWDLPQEFRCVWAQSPSNGHLELHSRNNTNGSVTVAVGVRAMGVDWCEAATVSRQTFNELLTSLGGKPGEVTEPVAVYVQSWNSHTEYVLDDGRRIVETQQPGGIIRRVWSDNIGDPYDYMQDESADWREMTPEEVDDLLPSVE